MVAMEPNSSLHILDQALRSGRTEAAAAAFRDQIGLAINPTELGTEVGKLLQQLYDDFEIVPFQYFTEYLTHHPAQEVAAPALHRVEKILGSLAEWQRLFRELSGERLARDLRARVRERHIVGATDAACQILARGTTDSARSRLARQVGSILGTLDHDMERAEQVIKALGRNLRMANLDPKHYEEMLGEFTQAHNNLSRSEMSQRELQFNLVHIDAVVRLMRFLPGGSVSQPGAEHELRFYSAMHLFISAWYADPSVCEFFDLARVLREFCPVDPKEAGPVEGVEDVAFLRMNSGDKIVSVRALRALGQKANLVETVLKASAGAGRDVKANEIYLTLMGGLSNPRFFSQLWNAFKSKTYPRLNSVIIDSIGRIGDDKSLRALQDLFDDCARTRLIDPPLRRTMTAVLAAIGRVARSPKTSNEDRNDIILKVFKSLPEDKPLTRIALEHLCTYNPKGMVPKLQRMVVAMVVADLWTMDPTGRMTRGNENQRTELGFREEMADILINMGSEILPFVLEEIEKRAMQFSGAYMAVGEILAKIGDSRALPLLEKLVAATLVTDLSRVPDHMQERYFDVATHQFVPLTTDKVAYSLLYAVQKRCGEAGQGYLLDLAERMQAGETRAIGGQSAAILQEVLMREKLKKESEARNQTAPEPATIASKVEEQRRNQPRPRQDDDAGKLIKEVRGKGLFGVKLEKRVSAMQELGARRSADAIGALCEQLDSSDRVLKAAAETALNSIVRMGDPPATLKAAFYELMEALREAGPARVKSISNFMLRLHPDRDPLKSMLLRHLQAEPDDKLKRKVAEIFKAVYDKTGEENQPATSAEEQFAQSEEEKAFFENFKNMPDLKIEIAPARNKIEDKYNARRDYFAQRQAWIANGKKGPEPQRPKDL